MRASGRIPLHVAARASAGLRKATAGPPETVAVWDIGVRLFHWLLVVAVTASLLTGFFRPWTSLRLHLIVGTAIAVLLGCRVVWGTLGTEHARFTSFAYRPNAVLRHIRELGQRGAARHLGHNPLGGLMVFALLLTLAASILAGLIVLGGVVKQGPLAAFVPFRVAWPWLRIHQALAILLTGLIGGHLLGVAGESWRSRENLLRAMITGRKSAVAAEPVGVVARPLLAACAVAVLGTVAAGGIAALSALPPRGVPPKTLDPTYAMQCGACHLAYPPSLAPAATWTRILGDLRHHFAGTDASLAPDLAASIGAYLSANSAEHWDTLPARMLRISDPADPRITATPFWRRMHRGIAAAVFSAPQVGGKGACEACHRDAATGRFAPQAIEVPTPLQHQG